ncbi:MAG TPA: hypothetical protein VLA00_14655 [Xanthobacteraceae bacterium]|nr:hypothetical protein [Xanthobacteraceae bacterium]
MSKLVEQLWDAVWNPVAWLAVVVAAGLGLLIGDAVGGDRVRLACNAAELSHQLKDKQAEALGLRGYIATLEAARRADAERYAADVAQDRVNQEKIDATPENRVPALDRAAAARVRGVR